VTAARPLRLAIDRIVVSASSGLDARRLADALPAALARALGPVAAGGEPRPAGAAAGAAEEAAAAIAAAVDARLRAGR
jgi:hypothetical protein